MMSRKRLEEIFADDTREKKLREQKRRVLEMCAILAIKKGSHSIERCTQEDVDLAWKHGLETRPHISYVSSLFSDKDVVEVIRQSMSLNHEIWNADFIQGVCRNGKIINSKKSKYKSFRWFTNVNIGEMISICPFGGRIGKNLNSPRPKDTKTWSHVPVLDVKYSTNTLSFIAGVLSVGELVEREGKTYVQYRREAISVIKDLNIPIEMEESIANIGGYPTVLISPFWPALFSLKMPHKFRERWFNIPNACNADLYAPILWRIYVDSYFPTAAIPYLKSKRAIYYQYKCEEGAISRFEHLSKEKGLIYLDHQIKEMINVWVKKRNNV